MRRVPEVIDVWFDSGCDAVRPAPRAVRERGRCSRQRFPADYICEAIDQTRGWFYSLLAISTLLFDRVALRDRALPRPHRRSRGQEDVEVARQHRRAVGGDRAARRRRVPLVLPHLQAAVGRLPVLDRDGRRVACASSCCSCGTRTAFYVLYANVNDVDRRLGGRATDLDRWVAVAAERDRRDGARAARRLRRHARRPRDRRVRRRALELVRAPLAPALLGRRPGRVRDAARRCLVDGVASCSRRSRPFIADEIYDNLDGSEPACTSCDFPVAGRARRGARVRDGASRARRSGSGLRRARRRPSSRCASRCARRWSSPPTRERAAIERLAGVVRDELNVKELRYVAAGRRARLLRGQAELPRARPALRQADAAGRRGGGGARPGARRRARCATAARVGISVDGHDHELGADDLLLAMQPLEGYQLEREGSHAVALELELDDELRREGLAREIVHAVQNARKAAGLRGRGPDRAARSAATTSCSPPPARTRTTSRARRSPSHAALRRRGDGDRRHHRGSAAADRC